MQVVDRAVHLAAHHEGVVHPAGGGGKILQRAHVEGGGAEVGAEADTVQKLAVVAPVVIIEGEVKEKVRRRGDDDRVVQFHAGCPNFEVPSKIEQLEAGVLVVRHAVETRRNVAAIQQKVVQMPADVRELEKGIVYVGVVVGDALFVVNEGKIGVG